MRTGTIVTPARRSLSSASSVSARVSASTSWNISGTTPRRISWGLGGRTRRQSRVITLSSRTRSATVRAIGPAVSRVEEIGVTPTCA